MSQKHQNSLKTKPVFFTLALTILLAVATASFAAGTSSDSQTFYAMMGGGGGMMSGGGMTDGNDMRDGRSMADGNNYIVPYRPDTRTRQSDDQRFGNRRDIPENDTRAQKTPDQDLKRRMPEALNRIWERLKSYNF
jgi:hypothetical protein